MAARVQAYRVSSFLGSLSWSWCLQETPSLELCFWSHMPAQELLVRTDSIEQFVSAVYIQGLSHCVARTDFSALLVQITKSCPSHWWQVARQQDLVCAKPPLMSRTIHPQDGFTHSVTLFTLVTMWLFAVLYVLTIGPMWQIKGLGREFTLKPKN